MKISISIQEKLKNVVNRLTKQGFETTIKGNVIKVADTSLELSIREDCVQANYFCFVALFEYDKRLMPNIKRNLAIDKKEKAVFDFYSNRKAKA